MRDIPPEVAELLKTERRVVLSFSTGKDSLTAWCVLRDLGVEVVPFYMALVPGLEFVERSLKYYEEFFGVHIYRCVHPSFYCWLNTYTAQPPRRKSGIDLLALPKFDYDAVEAGIRRTADAEECWTAVATRAADSVMRRYRLNQTTVRHNLRKFFPIAFYNKQDIIDTLVAARVKLPVDYKLFGRSWDGIDYRYLAAIRDHFPDDYQRILWWFPLIEAEFHRYEWGVKHGQVR